MLIWGMGSAELRQVRQHEVLKRHGYADDINPWARYDRAADRGRPLEPEVIPAGARRTPSTVFRQRLVQDAAGRWVMVSEPVYR